MLAHALIIVSLLLSLQGSASPKGPAAAARSNNTPTINILFFTASWCEPCRAVHPILEKVAHKYRKNAKLVIVDFDRAKEEAALWNVQEIPVVIVVSAEGELLLRYEGAKQEYLAKLNSTLEDVLTNACKGGEKCRVPRQHD
jgi:thioredoxin 1